MTRVECNVGGDYMSLFEGGHQYNPPCPFPAVFRYRVADPTNVNWFGGHWNYRCEQHVRWLTDRLEWEIEPLVAVRGGEGSAGVHPEVAA